MVTEAVVNQAPEAVASATPESGNAPLEVNFMGENSLDDVGVISYAWDFGDGNTSTETNPTHIYSEAGEYTAELTVTDGEGLTDTAEITIQVSEVIGNQAPVAIVSATPESGVAPLEVSFIGSGSTDDVDVVSFVWDFGNGDSSMESDPTYTYNEPGSYTVELTVADAEGLTATATFSIEVSGVEDVIAIIAPNPIPQDAENALIRVSPLPLDVVITDINVHDATGRFIDSFDPAAAYRSDLRAYEIPIFNLRDGLYYVTLEFDNADPIGIQMLVRN